MSDLLFRGRGADVGVRAPGWMLSLCGATVGLLVYLLADTLGLWSVIGIGSWTIRVLALVVGAVLARTRAGSLLWLAAGVLTTALMLVLYTPLVGRFAYAFVRRDPPTSSAGPPPDAVLVLSGGLTDEGRVTSPALDRLLTGIAEARRRGIPAMGLSVVSLESSPRRGGTTMDTTASVNSEADQRALVALAAPMLDVRYVYNVHSTRDEALAFAALARTHRWTRVVVVTSPLHTRRACAALEMTGLSVECRPAEPRDYALSRLDKSENRRLAFADAVYESAALLLYRARGWVGREKHDL